MKTALSGFAALLFASVLSAQYPFDRQIYRVEPDRGPVSGGTIVTIEGRLTFSGLADPCAGPHVFVGGVEAEVRSYDENSIEFVTPPYTAGRFDVVVDRCGARGALQNAFTYIAADGHIEWERILLPVFLNYDLPGAFGSVWRTTLTGFNIAYDTVITGRPDFACSFPSAATLPPCFVITPHGSFTPQIETDQHQPGRIIYIDRSDFARRIHFNLRVRDLSREASSLGAEVRPVFEDDAYGPFETFAIANVPLAANYRQKLRIYRIDTGRPAAVNIAFTADGTDVGARTIALSEEPLRNSFLLYPGYAEVDLDRLPELAGHERVDISIFVTAGRYWAYVSVTNNDTQEITTVTP